jgi:hypothetical protein
MTILFKTFTDAKNRLLAPVAAFKSLDPETESIAETPSYLKLFIVHEQRAEMVKYSDFMNALKNNQIKQIIP